MTLYVCSSCGTNTIVGENEDLIYCEVCGGHVFELNEEDIDETRR